jgi:hypothetical protein
VKHKKDLPFNETTVFCSKHGNTIPCIICRHLGEGAGMNYFAIKHDPWAWCEKCDEVLEEERDWSDRLNEFADWQVYCRQCYTKTLRRHHRVEWVRFAGEAD